MSSPSLPCPLLTPAGCGSALTALLLSPFSTSDLASHPLWQRFSLRPLERKSAASGSWRETVKALKLNGAEAAELMGAGGESESTRDASRVNTHNRSKSLVLT